RLLAGEPVLGIEPMTTIAHIPESIDPPHGASGVEDPVQLLGSVLGAREPAQHVRRAVPAVLPFLVCPVDLRVEVLEPAVMDGDELLPGRRSSEVPVRHAPLN